MNCRDSESLILAERDGGLNKEQLTGLSDHVAACLACQKLRNDFATAFEAYHTGLATMPVPDAHEAWRELQAKLPDTGSKPARRRPLTPVIWLGTSLAAAAALAMVFLVNRPAPPPAATEIALTPVLHDSSIIAGADYVEAGDPDASVMVYVDKDSGWLVVWATDGGAETSG